MDFSLDIQPVLSKELILSHLTEEQIFAFYLGPEIRSKKLFKSKLRNDKNPTCSMYRNSKNTLIYKDFATNEHLDCINYVMTLFKCNFYEALKIIANDFGIIKNSNIQKNRGKIISKDFKIEEKEFSKIQVEIQDFSESELKWWSKYGITQEILKKFNVYSCKHVWLNGNLMLKSQQNFPLFGYYGSKYQGNELWRIYMPKTKNGFKFMGNWPSKKIQGYDQLPKKGKLLVITKSLKDCLSMYSCGIPAIAPCSENLFISDNILDNLKTRFKYIVVFYDNDIPGIHNMKKIKKIHPELNYFFIPKKYEAKDFSDFYAKYGRKKTLETIKYYFSQLSLSGNKNFKD